MEARYMTDLEWRICHSVNIYLYRNGKDGETPILVHIPPSKKKNMKTVLSAIQERVQYPVGYAAYLFKMDGKKVRHPCELEMYNNYVVASNYDKSFKCAQYGRRKSPLLVLNRDSKHVRVLRQHNQNYHEWMLKKKAVGEERPQYIYPTFYTSENARAQDLPVGQMGNFVPPGAMGGCCPIPETSGGKDAGNGERTLTVNTCTLENSNTTKDVFKRRDATYRKSLTEIDNNTEKHVGHNKQKVIRNESDIANANILTDEGSLSEATEESVDEASYSENEDNENSKTFNESVSKSEHENLNVKYKKLVREIKRNLKSSGADNDTDSSDSSLLNSLQGIAKHKSSMFRNILRSTRRDSEFIILPPPPTRFRNEKEEELPSKVQYNNNHRNQPTYTTYGMQAGSPSCTSSETSQPPPVSFYLANPQFGGSQNNRPNFIKPIDMVVQPQFRNERNLQVDYSSDESNLQCPQPQYVSKKSKTSSRNMYNSNSKKDDQFFILPPPPSKFRGDQDFSPNVMTSSNPTCRVPNNNMPQNLNPQCQNYWSSNINQPLTIPHAPYFIANGQFGNGGQQNRQTFIKPPDIEQPYAGNRMGFVGDSWNYQMKPREDNFPNPRKIFRNVKENEVLIPPPTPYQDNKGFLPSLIHNPGYRVQGTQTSWGHSSQPSQPMAISQQSPIFVANGQYGLQQHRQQQFRPTFIRPPEMTQPHQENGITFIGYTNMLPMNMRNVDSFSNQSGNTNHINGYNDFNANLDFYSQNNCT